MASGRKYSKVAGPGGQEYQDAVDEAERLQNEIESELNGAYDNHRRIEKRLSTLPDRMDGIRERGYIYMPEMEQQLGELKVKWKKISPKVLNEFNRFTRYRGFGSDITFIIDAGFFGYDRFGLNQLRDTRERASQLNSKISTLISPVERPLSGLTFKVDHINRMLTDIKGATFDLGRGEKVGWSEKNDIIWGGRKRKCNIYFTNQRVIFEERATGILNKKKRKEIYSFPIDNVEGFDVDRGFLGIGDKVTIDFTGGDAVTVKVGNPDTWVARAQPVTETSFYDKVYSPGKKSSQSLKYKTAGAADEKNAKEAKKLHTLLDGLDEQLAMGKISEETYKKLRSKYEERLSRL